MLVSLLLLWSAAAAASGAAGDTAEGVVARMRQALGGPPALDAVRSLSLEADLRRVTPGQDGARDLSGEVSVEVLLPDRFLKVETLSPLPGGPSVSIGTGLDGQEAWRAPIGVPPAHGIVVRVQPPDTAGAAASLRARTRAEMTRLLLATGTTGGSALTYGYAGEAEAPEGRAHVLDVTGPEGFTARLFVDARTHLPLFLAFRAPVPQTRTMRVAGAGDLARARAEAEAAARAATPVPESAVRLFVSDYREVGGLRLPHRLLQEVEDGPTEEWTVLRWKVNPPLEAESFRKKG